MRSVIVGTTAIVVLAGSLHLLAGTAIQQQQAMPMAQMMQSQACPMKVQGATIATSNTKDGVALTFSAKSSESIAEVRRQVEQMAKMHDTMSGMAMGQGHMAQFTAKYEEVPNGARLTLTPKDPAQLTEFRKQVAAHVERMQKGDCQSFMQEMMPTMKHQ